MIFVNSLKNPKPVLKTLQNKRKSIQHRKPFSIDTQVNWNVKFQCSSLDIGELFKSRWKIELRLASRKVLHPLIPSFLPSLLTGTFDTNKIRVIRTSWRKLFIKIQIFVQIDSNFCNFYLVTKNRFLLLQKR